MALSTKVDEAQKPDGVRALKRSLAGWIARTLKWVIEPTLMPLLRWCSSYIMEDAPASSPVAYVSPEGSAINLWLLHAAREETIRQYEANGPERQRDLNAAMECFRNETIGGVFMVMFGTLIAKYPPDECLARINANVFMLGMTTQQLLQRAHAAESQPVETSEESANP